MKTSRDHSILLTATFFILLAFSQLGARSDQSNPFNQAPDWNYSIQLSASVQDSPPGITLFWDGIDGQYGDRSMGYTIYRKAKSATAWGNPIVTVDGSTFSYADTSVAVGSTYEYQIVTTLTNDSTATHYKSFGYIYSGIDASLTESRGTLILVVATESTVGLDNELAQLQSDLIGDGWQVIRHDVSSNDSPSSVRSQIVSDYNADPTHVSAVFLFGHVPILQSGEVNYDGHGARPMPSDGYYGDMNGNWGGSPSTLPSDVELMVGRVDLANMPAAQAPGTWPSETELLRNYLNKNHRWRFAQISVPRRALIGERFGVLQPDNEMRSSSGFRNVAPFVGLGNTVLADISDNANPGNRWSSMLASGSYLWTYGNGGGQDDSISELGTHGQFSDVWSTDLYAQDAKAVFFMLEGSHFGNWDHPDDIVRAVLGMRSMGLVCCNIIGHPQWYMHHMGLGEPIGYSVRLTMNNTSLYQDTTNEFQRAVYIALMGDPTLRMDPVQPPAVVNASSSGGTVNLSWAGSAGAAGYNIYRAPTVSGTFMRVNSDLVGGTGYQDTTAPSGTSVYMVRAVALTVNPSGSYYNPSQGTFVRIDNSGGGSTGDTNTLPSTSDVQPGIYNGLVLGNSVDPQTSGDFSISVNSHQKYSGRVTVGGQHLSISGTIASGGSALSSIKRGKAGTTTVSLTFGLDDQAGKVFGTVSDADFSANLSGGINSFNTKTNPAPEAGNYTILLPGTSGDANQPAGSGYATMRVQANGSASIQGELADGTKFNDSANLTSDGAFPLYVPVYSGKGCVVGWLNFENGGSDGLNGTVSWLKPDGIRSKSYPGGFSEQLSAMGSPYHSVKNAGDLLGNSNATLTFSGNNIDTFSNEITLDSGNHVTNLSSNRLHLSFTLSSGKFSGSVVPPTGGKAIPFSGVVLQNNATGGGFFISDNQSGNVTITAGQ